MSEGGKYREEGEREKGAEALGSPAPAVPQCPPLVWRYTMTLGGSISLHISIRGNLITRVTWQGGVGGRSRPNLDLVWGGG